MIDENTTPYEALTLALEKEKEAYALYKKGAEVVKDQSVQKMFDFLAKEGLMLRTEWYFRQSLSRTKLIRIGSRNSSTSPRQ